MSFYDKFVLMSVDARNSYVERHKNELGAYVRNGSPPPILDDEVITVTKEQMLAFGIKYRITNREELLAALEAHPEEAGFTAIQVTYLFKSANGFYSQIKDEIGLLYKGKRISDEEFFARLSQLHIKTLAEYKAFLKTPEGKGWPLITPLYKKYGNVTLLFAAIFSKDMDLQYKLYMDSSVLRGTPLNAAECVQLGIEYKDLCDLIGEENLIKIAQNKIEQYAEGERGFETIEDILDKRRKK